jgi:hypothetical protein
MLNLSENFQQQFTLVQQQFNQWRPFEQLYASIELTRILQLSYRHYLAQFLQNEIQCENNEMFNHTVDQANTPGKVIRPLPFLSIHTRLCRPRLRRLPSICAPGEDSRDHSSLFTIGLQQTHQ